MKILTFKYLYYSISNCFKYNRFKTNIVFSFLYNTNTDKFPKTVKSNEIK